MLHLPPYQADNLVEALTGIAQQAPEFLSLVFVAENGERQHVTAETLVEQTGSMARGLQALGVPPRGIVLLALNHSLTLETLFLGAIFAYAIPSIYPYLTPRMDQAHFKAGLLDLARQVQASAIVTSAPLQASMVSAESLPCPVYTPQDITDAAIGSSAPWRGLAAQEEDTIFLQFSSGTTGRKKGVAITYGIFNHHMRALQEGYGWHSADVWVCWLPLHHDMGLFNLLTPLANGMTVVSLSPFTWLRQPHVFYQLISHYRGSISAVPNFALNYDIHNVRERDLDGLNLSSLRYLLCGSEPVRHETLEAYKRRFATYGFPASALKPAYGMAENAVAVALTPHNEPYMVDWIDLTAFQTGHVAQPAGAAQGKVLPVVSCGNVIDGTQLRLVDPNGRVLPEREVGEVQLSGRSLFGGYFGQPELTAQAFDGHWYRTGDLGYLADGRIYITGRQKDLIISGGRNIYARDIEDLVSAIDGVAPGRVAAFGVYDPQTASEGVVVVAELRRALPETEAAALKAIIRRLVAQRLDAILYDLQLVDGPWVIKTSSGKVAGAANRDKYVAEFKPNSSPSSQPGITDVSPDG